ncbi:MAG: iron-sulfur cluster assembly scaffold protein [Desulfobacterales bacterium]|nr:iron-sulfur cluster assembly scaffold protein [Desulfobacterales bacterium]
MKAEETKTGLSPRFVEMATDRSRVGAMNRPDGHSKKTGECGDTIEMFIRGTQDNIMALTFVIDGCVNTLASSNAVARFVEGKDVQSAWDVTPEMIIEFLDGLPPAKHHCAELAVGTLYLALVDLASAKSCYQR